MSKEIESAKLLGTYREMQKLVASGRMSETPEEKEAVNVSINACLESIGAQYPFGEIQEAIKLGREEFKSEFPSYYGT